jgi:hypothetical protein
MTCESFPVLHKGGGTQSTVHCASVLLSELRERLELFTRKTGIGRSRSQNSKYKRHEKHSHQHDRHKNKSNEAADDTRLRTACEHSMPKH